MNQVNKTLYIPLYGKAFVSKKNTFFHDPKAEEIWQKEGFKLKGKSKSKWLAYGMAMRAKVFDEWTIKHIHNNSIVLHLGCGMDSRYERIGMNCIWYDIDFEEVIQERRKYFKETDSYHLIATDIRQNDWLKKIPKNKDAIIIMEGISMYLTNEELKQLFQSFTQHFNQIIYLSIVILHLRQN